MDAITVETVTGPLSDDDLAALVGSLVGLWRADAAQHDPTIDPTWPDRLGAAYYRDLLSDPNGLVLAARVGGRTGGEIVGHLVGRFVAADDFRTVSTAVLESMQVRSDLRGQGVGGLLVDAFLAWAAKRGSGRASVTANTGNTGATAFYRKHGFVPASVTLRRRLAAG
jgi:GNAT superfamily N-acetyltransferase